MPCQLTVPEIEIMQVQTKMGLRPAIRLSRDIWVGQESEVGRQNSAFPLAPDS
jgi:hypothetical protein